MHLIKQKRSWSHINQIACALRFLYGVTLGKRKHSSALSAAASQISSHLCSAPKEIARFLRAVPGMRNRVILATAYAAGLRVGEVARLKVSSIDSREC